MNSTQSCIDAEEQVLAVDELRGVGERSVRQQRITGPPAEPDARVDVSDFEKNEEQQHAARQNDAHGLDVQPVDGERHLVYSRTAIHYA